METLKDAIVPENVLDEVIEQCKDKPGMLLKVLDQVQSKNMYKYLPEETIKALSVKLKISYEEIMKSVNMFSFFNVEPQGLHTVIVCTGISCHGKKSNNILNEVGTVLGYDVPQMGREGSYTTPDLLYTIKTQDCIGDCDFSPLVMVDGTYHNEMNRFKLQKVLKPIINK